MKVTLNWLREYVDLPDDPAAVAAALESLGHEVEGTEHLERRFDGVVVARVLGVRPHPDADRVRLARVTTGGGETEVVCGAWNFGEGAVVAFAPPGAMLAGGLEVGTRTIRGIASPGMICSERELGLGDDHEGILVLDPATTPGADFAGLVPLPDVVFDLSITTNRPDAMGVIGLARDLAAYFRTALRLPDISVAENGLSDVAIDLEDPGGCPRYVAREIRGVTVAPSPPWMAVRLRAVGIRPINNVVDATNYTLIEMGHPTHAFDRAALGDRVVVRRARPGETLVTLDGMERKLDPADLVIADGSAPVAFAGVMGGEATEVGAGTTDVLVESAYFDAASVLLTSKRHALRTEASARFERGMDPNGAAAAAARVAHLVTRLAGGEAAAAIDAYPDVVEPITLSLDPGEPARVLGTPLDPATVTDLLVRLGFGVSGTGPLAVTVPTRRPDIDRPVDLLEEVARLHGYDNIPETIARGPGGGLPRRERRYRELRRVLVGAGCAESMSLSFMAAGDLDALAVPADDPRRAAVRVTNPMRDGEDLLRSTMLPGLLRAVARNLANGRRDVALFETGRVFLSGERGPLPDQPETLAFALAGEAGAGWHGPGRPRDALDAAGLWQLLARAMQVEDSSLEPASVPGFHPARAARVAVGGEVLGTVGELHPRVAAAFDIAVRVAVGEVRIEPLLGDPGLWQFRAPAPYPPAIFDLAFETPEDLRASRLVAGVRAAAGRLLEDLEVFDVFRGAPLPPGRRSVAVRLTYRAPDHTLTDEEVAPLRRAVVDEVTAELAVTLRGAGG